MRGESKLASRAKSRRVNWRSKRKPLHAAWSVRQCWLAPTEATAELLLVFFVLFLEDGGGGDGVVGIKP